MSISNGKIIAPVSIEDVKIVLGEPSNDLATLCKSENINIWSKYKPINCRGGFKESPIREDSYETATSSFNKYNCDIRCGMNIPIDTYRNLYNNFSGEGFAIKACTDFYQDNVYGYNGVDKDASSSSHIVNASGKHFPKGGTNSPYRLGDFRNYNNNAKHNTFLSSIPELRDVEIDHSSIPSFNCIFYKNTNVDDTTNLTMEDIIPDLYSAWSFWIQIRYDSPNNIVDKIYKNYYIGNCKEPTDYIYASKEITFDIGNDKKITIVPFLAYTHSTTLSTDSGTPTVTMAPNTTYKLSTGGTNVVFKTPSMSMKIALTPFSSLEIIRIRSKSHSPLTRSTNKVVASPRLLNVSTQMAFAISTASLNVSNPGLHRLFPKQSKI